MGCAKCGAATRYEFCVACESDILETMLNETVSNTECAKCGVSFNAEIDVINCYVKRPLLALPEWSTCQHTHWYRVRFADNGKDNGYRNHVRAHSPNDARRMVLRDGEWNGHDNREIVSVECFTDYPEPEFETNTYRGLDVGAYGDY